SRNPARVVQAAARAHEIENPARVRWRAVGARPRQIPGYAGRLARIRLAQQMNQHQRALAFDQVSADLLAVAAYVAGQVEEVVLNLKRGTEIAAETVEPIEVEIASRRDQRADATGMDEAVPARLLQDHPQVVVVGDVAAVVAHPAKLHRLALERLLHH